MNIFVRSSRDPYYKANDPKLKTTVLNAANIFNVHAFFHGICK